MNKTKVFYAMSKRPPVIEALLVLQRPMGRAKAGTARLNLRQAFLWRRNSRVSTECQSWRTRSPEYVPPMAESTVAVPGQVFVQDGRPCGIWVNGRDGKPTVALFPSDVC
jgi:hypothetical protein